MTHGISRIFVEKKPGFDVEAQKLCKDFRYNLGVTGLKAVRLVNRYDVTGLQKDVYLKARNTIFSEPPVDAVYDEQLPLTDDAIVFAVEYLPGQYDQRADSAAQCVQILTQGERPEVKTARVLILEGDISAEQLESIKSYYINPVESREASLDKPASLELRTEEPTDVKTIDGFIDWSEDQLRTFMDDIGFAMNFEDLRFCQEYFGKTERRNPTITELKVIDTYWSDHCRHTTFMTSITDVEFINDRPDSPIKQAFQHYNDARDYVYGDQERTVCLMDLAVIGMKELRKRGKLDDLDVSDEVNACSIVVKVDVDGVDEEWLVMFKNETHNHPTEIEPFGGAATCLGGAIRDPLSGRSYVYQAMRVTGSGDPRAKLSETLPGKLPQRKITTEAAAGYSSYGNQIGLATGHVAEIYDQGYIAKRMEIGAVIAAAPKENVVRETPVKGDVIILAGGRTGRDGCGGATGSSREHDEESLFSCGAEVQKGNPPTERKLQRLFRNPQVSKLIKKCNDFGAGGVSVAIGELTDSLRIDLDAVPKKYAGLDGTELAISESQERMAVVVAASDAERFIQLAKAENVEATIVAEVTDNQRLQMVWREKAIVDISRQFLDTNGVRQTATIKVVEPDYDNSYFRQRKEKYQAEDIQRAWMETLTDLNVCSQKGLVERFDSTIGAGTVLMPFGGTYQLTPAQGMAAKIPVLHGETTTATLMSHGYNPQLSKWSPFHGAYYAVIEAAAKIVAMGGDFSSIRLTFQEYFEKLGTDPVKWGKPFSALLGALQAQADLEIPAIGGKDSMSGTFKDLHVPPTLVAFAVNVVNAAHVISPEFKQPGNTIAVIRAERGDDQMIDVVQLRNNFALVTDLIQTGKAVAAYAITQGGLAEAVSKMAFGNKIGADINLSEQSLFTPDYGAIVLELSKDTDIDELAGKVPMEVLGQTTELSIIKVNGVELAIEDLIHSWMQPLENIFPTKTPVSETEPPIIRYDALQGQPKRTTQVLLQGAKPRVIIPVFPGTNCEYDSQLAFEKAGGRAETLVIRNLTSADIEESIEVLAKSIDQSQIMMLPGGFSGGDEPDGSGKFYATLFRNPKIKDAVMNLLYKRDGLVLGICNGFQALIKLGLLPYGEIRDMTEESPTLTFNTIGRHISCVARTKIVSNLSPWFNQVRLGDIHSIPLSHGEGRFVANEVELKKLVDNGQIATQYVNHRGVPSYHIDDNPNGSMFAIEAITSPDGRILGKMGHSERIGNYVAGNISGDKDQGLFVAGIRYFG